MQISEKLKNWQKQDTSLLNPTILSNVTPRSNFHTNQISSEITQVSSTEKDDISFEEQLFQLPNLEKLSKYDSNDDFNKYDYDHSFEYLSNSYEQKSTKKSSKWSESRKNQKKASNCVQENLLKSTIKKSHSNKNKNEKNLFQIKRLLAILKNWKEVCKTIPENIQESFKEKIRKFVQKKIFYNNVAENEKIQASETVLQNFDNECENSGYFCSKENSKEIEWNNDEGIVGSKQQENINFEQNNKNYFGKMRTLLISKRKICLN